MTENLGPFRKRLEATCAGCGLHSPEGDNTVFRLRDDKLWCPRCWKPRGKTVIFAPPRRTS